MASQDLRSATPPAHDFPRVKDALKECIEAEILAQFREAPQMVPPRFSQISHGQEMMGLATDLPVMAGLEDEIEEFAARLAAADR
jgi:hypothetical protein